MLAHTRPCLSAIASMVIHANLVVSGSHQIVDSVMDEKSFVKVTLIHPAYSRYEFLHYPRFVGAVNGLSADFREPRIADTASARAFRSLRIAAMCAALFQAFICAFVTIALPSKRADARH